MRFLEEAVKHSATDLHLTEGSDAVIRVHGKMSVLGACSESDYRQITQLLIADSSIVMNANEKVKDFSTTLPDIGRVRVRCYEAGGKKCMAIRFLPTVIPLPEKAQLFHSYVCDCCGELTGANWIRMAGEQKLCLDCYNTYDRFHI